MQALGLVVLAERLRANAGQTVAFFAEQGVELKVLSGDAPATVGAIARDAGVPGSAPALDGEALPSDPAALRDAVLSAPAVGRISPEGKRAVVAALAGAGRYVAMVGDGVNDVPALKQARLAIAQGSGTQMARSVADLVLVRDDFGVVPGMVAEGRQILRNIQRVARLFVTKTVFTAVVGLAIAIPTGTFPLLPRQFTIASTVTIGIPAFLLALAPSSGPWRPEPYLRSVARFAIPAGVAIGIGIIAGYLLARYGFDLGLDRSRTVATGIVVVCGLAVVIRLESEHGWRRVAIIGLCALMALLFALALIVPFLRSFYELSTPTGRDRCRLGAGNAHRSWNDARRPTSAEGLKADAKAATGDRRRVNRAERSVVAGEGVEQRAADRHGVARHHGEPACQRGRLVGEPELTHDRLLVEVDALAYELLAVEQEESRHAAAKRAPRRR